MFAVIVYTENSSDSKKIKRDIVPVNWIKNFEDKIIKNKSKVIYFNGNQKNPKRVDGR
jgi:hypothetical protein